MKKLKKILQNEDLMAGIAFAVLLPIMALFLFMVSEVIK